MCCYPVEQASPLARAGQTRPARLHKRARLCCRTLTLRLRRASVPACSGRPNTSGSSAQARTLMLRAGRLCYVEQACSLAQKGQRRTGPAQARTLMLRAGRVCSVEQASPLARAGQTRPARLHKRGRVCDRAQSVAPTKTRAKQGIWRPGGGKPRRSSGLIANMKRGREAMKAQGGCNGGVST